MTVGLCAAIGMILLIAVASRGRSDQPPRRLHGVVRFLVTGFMLWPFLALVFLVPIRVALSGGVWLLPLPIVALIVLAPWVAIRSVLIPSGMVRSSFWMTYWAHVTWRRDRAGAMRVAALLALFRRERSHDEPDAWVAAKVDELAKLQGAGVLAVGLLASDRGDREVARAVMRTVADVKSKYCPGAARALAADWLIADAADRGDWRQVRNLAQESSKTTGNGRFLAAVAARILGEEEPDTPLWLLWLLAGRRRTLWPLLHRANAARPAPPTHKSTTAQAEALDGALHALLAFDALPDWARTPHRAAALGDAWDRALGAEHTRSWLADRAAALGADGDAALAGLRESVLDRMRVAVASAVDLDVARTEGLLQEAAWNARDEAMEAVEELARELRDRLLRGDHLCATDELRAWARIRAAHARAVRLGGADARMALFPAIDSSVGTQSVVLFNKRREWVLSDAMSRWLRDEATLAGDVRAAEVHTRNLACLA